MFNVDGIAGETPASVIFPHFFSFLCSGFVRTSLQPMPFSNHLISILKLLEPMVNLLLIANGAHQGNSATLRHLWYSAKTIWFYSASQPNRIQITFDSSELGDRGTNVIRRLNDQSLAMQVIWPLVEPGLPPSR